MNRSIAALVCIISAFLLFIISLIGCKKVNPTQPMATGPASLHVPFYPQIADELCWAACTQMVSTYYHNNIDSNAPALSQCMVAAFNSAYTPPCNCDTLQAVNIPWQYNQGSEPFPPNPATGTCLGYIETFTDSVMSWDTLCAHLRSKQPVSFGWGWEGVSIRSVDSTGNHFMVAEGVPHSSYISHGWVSVHDPWPTGKGAHRVMAYSEFANQIPVSVPGQHADVYSKHYGDYYLLSYQAPAKQ